MRDEQGRHRVEVGRWIRVRRDELGLTRRQFADRVGVDEKTISTTETGSREPRFKTPYEDVLGWPRGSLTVAYRDGVRPVALSTPDASGGREPSADDLIARLAPDQREAAWAMLRALDAAHSGDDRPRPEQRRDAG